MYKPDRLNELMADSDYVVMALPYTPDTHHFVNAAAINSMRPNGVLINVGRGKTLEETALVKGALPNAPVSMDAWNCFQIYRMGCFTLMCKVEKSELWDLHFGTTLTPVSLAFMRDICGAHSMSFRATL